MTIKRNLSAKILIEKASSKNNMSLKIKLVIEDRVMLSDEYPFLPKVLTKLLNSRTTIYLLNTVKINIWGYFVMCDFGTLCVFPANLNAAYTHEYTKEAFNIHEEVIWY